MTTTIAFPPIARETRWRRWWQGLAGSPLNLAITLAILLLAARFLPPLVRWAVLDATWSGTAETCAANGGACWAFVAAKLRVILFGLYPPGLQWRPAVAIVAILLLVVATATPRLWHRRLVLAWLAVPVLVWLLVSDGMALGPRVPTDAWGGLFVTLLLAVIGFVAAFPLAILLALGRRSGMGGLRLLCTTTIEVLRGVPFIGVLYVATLLFPLMLPQGTGIDKFLRAQIAITLFIAAYLAEIIRGGLQAIPPGQYDAAAALGLSYGKTMGLIVLPQALRLVIPSLVTLAIGIFQDTTLVIVIGMFDLLNAARVAATDPAWLGYYTEAFSAVALVYFVFCFIGSRYSLWLERRLRPEGR